MVLSEESRPKSAFVSVYGKWEFKRCPFGLAQAPAYLQRLVNEVLSGLTFAFVYLDDILGFSPDIESHLKHLRTLSKRLRSTDLKLKAIKHNYLKKHIQYLGHIISGEGKQHYLKSWIAYRKCYHPKPQRSQAIFRSYWVL